LGASPVVVRARRIPADLGLLTAFWIYVALSNVLYGASMQASLEAIGASHVFAAWDARLLQHLFLYPVLLACMWCSRRIAWQPLWRAVPLQLLCAVAFAALASPALDLGEHLVERLQTGSSVPPIGPAPMHSHSVQAGYIWLAVGTNFLLTYGFCLALLTGFDFYRRYRDSQLRSEALERSLSAAHLAALRMQLSPHTLFNLLHTIRGNIAWDPDAAQAMIVQLGDLLRRLLRAGERDLSRLQDEMDFVRLYLELQRRRFADRLAIALPDPGTLPAAWVPSLILQPLIENAVVHGLARHEGPVTIRVEVAVAEETLRLRVVNTIAAVPAAGPAEAPHGAEGIGLKNVRERLAIQLGDRAALQTTVSDPDVWVAEIQMPLLRTGS
jgi:hypothetical protein